MRFTEGRAGALENPPLQMLPQVPPAPPHPPAHGGRCVCVPPPKKKAFVVLSDLLLVLGPRLAQDGRAALEPLLLAPGAGLQSQLAAFLMDHVFQREPSAPGNVPSAPPGAVPVPSVSPPTPSPSPRVPADDAESRAEELHRRRVLLAGFCKLVVYNVLELSAASDVFKHYGKVWGAVWGVGGCPRCPRGATVRVAPS